MCSLLLSFNSILLLAHTLHMAAAPLLLHLAVPQMLRRITAFAQLLPNHLEVSYQTGSQIFLWPPMEAYYPGMFDFESMLRYLQQGQKLKRTKRSVRNKRSRCKLGFQRTTPYHKQRVI